MMLTRPAQLPDETVFSLLARIVRLNGMDSLAATGSLMGEAKPTSVIGCPANIRHFCNVTEGAYYTASILPTWTLHNAPDEGAWTYSFRNPSVSSQHSIKTVV